MKNGLDQGRVFDGFTSLEGGMNGGSATNLLPRSEVAFAMNATMRTGYLNNRPGWRRFNLSFQDEDTQNAYINGVFQGAGWYVPLGFTNPQLFVSVSGHIYQLSTNSMGIVSVVDLTIPGDPNDALLPKAWFCQSDSFLVIQDGIDAPYIYDGAVLRRSNIEGGEVPTGSAMACGYGRLFLVRGQEVEAGDILNAAKPNSAISFTEVKLKKDAFAVPTTAGPITALIFGANIDTSIGQGPLQLHTASGLISTVNITVSRNDWTTTPNFQQDGLIGGAATGQESTVNVNNDTWYRAQDGIRSFVVARRQFSTWGNTPQSREVSNILNFDTRDLLKYVSGVWFDNRLLMTCSPQKRQNTTGWYFQGLTVLDFDLLSTLNRYSGSLYSQDPQPSYDGIWSGINITQITKTYFGPTERCFMTVWDEENGNQLWELLPSLSQDYSSSFDNGSCPILSWIETGSYNFQSLTAVKQLIGADLWIDQLQGSVDFDVKFSPDQYPFWINWQTFNESDGKPCGEMIPRDAFTFCQVPVTSPPQYRSRIRLQQPEETFAASPTEPSENDSPETDYPLTCGYDFRFRIQWQGRCRIKGLRAFAYLQPERTTGRKP